MESENNGSWVKKARRRGLITGALIPAVTLYWVILLMYTNLPPLMLGIVAVVSLLLLSVAIAWTVTAVPAGQPGSGHRERPLE